MSSRTFELVANHRTPQEVLDGVIDLMITAERCYPIGKEAREIFNAQNPSWGRSWGENMGDPEAITAVTDFSNLGLTVQYSYEESSRGCHMGTSKYEIFVPDHLIFLHEASQEEEGYDNAQALEREIEAQVKQKAMILEGQASTKRRQEEAERQAKETAAADAARLLLEGIPPSEVETRYQTLIEQGAERTGDDVDEFLIFLLDNESEPLIFEYLRRASSVDKVFPGNPRNLKAWPRLMTLMDNVVLR